MSQAVAFPRGAGGSVLYPKTKVVLTGLAGKGEKWNDWEGSCEKWDPEKGRMHVLLTNGEWKSLRPPNIRKVVTGRGATTGDAVYDGIVQIFQKFDINGDGILDMGEFNALLKSIGLNESHIQAFLLGMDKDGDREVDYTEFATWALAPMSDSKNHRYEVYWPELPPEADMGDHLDGEENRGGAGELTIEELARLAGPLPAGWPLHGIKVVNNMRARFPGYPVEGIVMFMIKNDFVGGKVIAAIRATGAKEAEVAISNTVVPIYNKPYDPGDDKPYNRRLPAEYRVRSGKHIKIFREDDPNWSWENLRDDNKLSCHKRFYEGDSFTLLEVRSPLGYDVLGVRQFGRVAYGTSLRDDIHHWVYLGLEREEINGELSFTEAERVPS